MRSRADGAVRRDGGLDAAVVEVGGEVECGGRSMAARQLSLRLPVSLSFARENKAQAHGHVARATKREP